MGVFVNLSDVRRNNAVALMQENALDELSFALCLGLEESQVLVLLEGKAKKKIGDSLARLMEQTFSKSVFWLDEEQGGSASTGYDLFG